MVGRAILVLLLAGCASEPTANWADLPQEQAPIPQTFTLDVEATSGGDPITFTVSGLQANTSVRVVRAVNGSSQPGPCPPALGGECLDIDGPGGIAVFGFTLTTNNTGSASRTLTLPSTVADGTAVSFQAVAPSLGVGSNTVDLVVGPADPLANAQCEPTYASCTEQAFDLNDFTATTGIIDIDMVGLRPYDPKCLTVRVGQTVRIEATNSHPFRVDCAEDDVMDASDGSPSTVTFTFDTPGYYNYRCAVRSHASMVGNIRVLP